MRTTAFLVPLLAILAHVPARAADPPKLELKDGDRIVYLGNTFAERDASYGYLETLLTARHPDISFTFRNLGWSGDTVWGDARARFGTRADGFKHLKEHVLALRPTVILVAYGMNESFAGEAGLKEFEAGLNTLLDTLAETKARLVLISPLPHENLGPPLPDPAKHNADLGRYCSVIEKAASDRGSIYIDIFRRTHRKYRQFRQGNPSKRPSLAYTNDGLHPTEYGYTDVDLSIFDLATQAHPPEIQLQFGGSGVVQGPTVKKAERTPSGYRFDVLREHLPNVTTPQLDGTWTGTSVMEHRGLEPGAHRLLIDGTEVSRFLVSDKPTAVRSAFTSQPEIDQVEKLRAAINKKNELYFNRWRPQNETYLFGFRKHEQGNNAVEIPQFDPLVAEMEAEIARLKKPVPHTYELIREEAGK